VRQGQCGWTTDRRPQPALAPKTPRRHRLRGHGRKVR
jgi:hypothetical protein